MEVPFNKDHAYMLMKEAGRKAKISLKVLQCSLLFDKYGYQEDIYQLVYKNWDKIRED